MSESLNQPSIDPSSPETKKPKKRRTLLIILVLAFFTCAACGLFSLFFLPDAPQATTSERGADTGAAEESAETTADLDEESEPEANEDTAPADAPESAAPLDIDPTAYIASYNMSPDELPQGDPGLSVILAGPPSMFGAVPVVVRNNTDEPVYDIQISATARDAAGAILGTGPGRDFSPSYVPPGGVAFGRVLFGDTPLDNATIDYLVSGDQSAGFIFSSRDLDINEHNLVNGNVVGLMVNSHNTPVTLINVVVACFDDDLVPTTIRDEFTDQDRVEGGAELPFSVDLLGDEAQCGRYLVAGSGWRSD